jgi:hypothetical protein
MGERHREGESDAAPRPTELGYGDRRFDNPGFPDVCHPKVTNSIDNLNKSTEAILKLLNGGDVPANGILVRLDRIEQSALRREEESKERRDARRNVAALTWVAFFGTLTTAAWDHLTRNPK